MSFLRKAKGSFQQIVGDDFRLKRSQLFILLLVLAYISGGMSIVNIATKQSELFTATALFCVFSLFSALVAFIDKKGSSIASSLLVIEIIVLLTYFIVSGGAQGFSTIWLLLIPTCSMFTFGIKKGSVLSAFMLAELIFFFYTSYGRSLLQCPDYTQAFLLRFPFVYLAFFIVGIFLELVRHETYAQLNQSRERYQFLSYHDELTKLYNRVGFNLELNHAVKECTAGTPFALMIMDLDHFKGVNDTYGHAVGDTVLRSVAKTISSCIEDKNAVACRWGGEEFAVLLHADDAAHYLEVGEAIRASVESVSHNLEYDIRGTISIGTVHSRYPDLTTATQMVLTADRLLYRAKHNGRNRVEAHTG